MLQGTKREVWRVGQGGVRKYEFGTWTTLAISVLYLLQPARREMAKQLLDNLLPNQTLAWNMFKETVIDAYELRELPENAPVVNPPLEEEQQGLQTVWDEMRTALQDLQTQEPQEQLQPEAQPRPQQQPSQHQVPLESVVLITNMYRDWCDAVRFYQQYVADREGRHQTSAVDIGS